MPYTLEIKIPGLPSSTNSRFRHWAVAAKEKKFFRNSAFLLATKQAPAQPLRKCKIVCTRHSFGHRAPDYDNLCISFKPILDGLTDAGIWVDDNQDVIVERQYRWERAMKGKGFVTVEVTEIE